jgi:flagellin
MLSYKEKNMSITINTNTQSLFAQRALGANTQNMQRSIEKLSTGFRINRAADDAAGLSITEKLNSQIRGLDKAAQNIGDGISLVQTAEGGLSVVQDNLQRIRELWVQAVNGTNGAKERDAIQREINERVKTIDDVAKATKFNGQNLLRGGSNITIQSGADNAQTSTITLAIASEVGIDINIDSTAAGSMGDGAGVGLNKYRLVGATVNSQDNTNADAGSLDGLDTILNNVSRMRSYLGAVQNSLESKLEYVNIAMENASASRSRVKDVDVAKESSVMIKNQILQQSAAAMLSQANQTPQIAMNLLP